MLISQRSSTGKRKDMIRRKTRDNVLWSFSMGEIKKWDSYGIKMVTSVKKSGLLWHIPYVLQSLRGRYSPYLS